MLREEIKTIQSKECHRLAQFHKIDPHFSPHAIFTSERRAFFLIMKTHILLSHSNSLFLQLTTLIHCYSAISLIQSKEITSSLMILPDATFRRHSITTSFDSMWSIITDMPLNPAKFIPSMMKVPPASQRVSDFGMSQ